MFGLDDKIASLGSGEAFLIVIAVAVLLGLRHATDPDHLVAVSTLVASSKGGSRNAAALGISWGLGHATTLVLFGLPIVLFNDYLPERVQQAAEVAIGVVIVLLALRLLVRWHRNGLHPQHRHDLGRSPFQAFAIGLVHGMGGSAGVGVLLLAAIPDHVEGALALVLFAVLTAVSMAIASTSLGYTLARGPVARRFASVAPVLGALSLGFGCWYALGALEALPYYF
jgi:high-affinity nickel permease